MRANSSSARGGGKLETTINQGWLWTCELLFSPLFFHCLAGLGFGCSLRSCGTFSSSRFQCDLIKWGKWAQLSAKSARRQRILRRSQFIKVPRSTLDLFYVLVGDMYRRMRFMYLSILASTLIQHVLHIAKIGTNYWGREWWDKIEGTFYYLN